MPRIISLSACCVVRARASRSRPGALQLEAGAEVGVAEGASSVTGAEGTLTPATLHATTSAVYRLLGARPEMVYVRLEFGTVTCHAKRVQCTTRHHTRKPQINYVLTINIFI